MRKLLLLACLFFSIQLNVYAAPGEDEDTKGILDMSTILLNTPNDTNNILRAMAGVSIAMWLENNEQKYTFHIDSSLARISGDDAYVAMIMYAAVVEYQINKKIPNYNTKVRNAAVKRMIKYVTDPANNLPPYTTAPLLGAVMADKKGKLEDYLDRISKPIDKTSTAYGLDAATYILNSPYDTANKVRKEQTDALFHWMVATPDYGFSMALLEFSGAPLPVVMAAMAEYQIVNKVKDYDNKVRNAAVRRLIQYANNPANKLLPTTSTALKNAIEADKQGKLDEYLDK